MSRSSDPGWRVLLGMLSVFVWLAQTAGATEVVVSGRITYEIRDGIYVNRGADDGLRQGMLGSLRFDDGGVFAFEVLNVARESALLRLTSRPARRQRLAGLMIELVFEQVSPSDENKDKSGESSAESTSDRQDEFVPLLAPPQWNVGLPRTSNISHGQIRIRQMLQADNEGFLDYSITRLGSSGSLDKIEGSQWSFEWSGDLAYRAGDALRYHPDYEEPRLDLYLASLYRPIGEDGFFRFGRFLPRELPGIGYIDGVQTQGRHSDNWNLGVVAGLKPDRSNLDPSGHEPTAATYATFEAGDRDGSHYLATAGLLGSLYKGRADRLALLFDQRASWGSSLTLYSTTEVDFDVGGAETRTGTRLTRLDLSAVSRPSSFLTLRAGVDHWERPDNRAERDLLVIEDDRLFDRGFWRYWVGSDQGLPWNLRLSEEIAFIDSPDYDYDPRWRIGLTRRGLLSWPEASATATVYNLDAPGLEGHGLRLSAYLPLLKHKLFVQPTAGFRMLDADPQSQDFEVNYLSLRLHGRLSSTRTLSGGFTHTYGDSVDATLVDLGLRFAW
ncbi:MAG: hypothetical protein ACYS0H_00785 [Planctomycetota bacterium]|jgi:hypothetical protein